LKNGKKTLANKADLACFMLAKAVSRAILFQAVRNISRMKALPLHDRARGQNRSQGSIRILSMKA